MFHWPKQKPSLLNGFPASTLMPCSLLCTNSAARISVKSQQRSLLSSALQWCPLHVEQRPMLPLPLTPSTGSLPSPCQPQWPQTHQVHSHLEALAFAKLELLLPPPRPPPRYLHACSLSFWAQLHPMSSCKYHHFRKPSLTSLIKITLLSIFCSLPFTLFFSLTLIAIKHIYLVYYFFVYPD